MDGHSVDRSNGHPSAVDVVGFTRCLDDDGRFFALSRIDDLLQANHGTSQDRTCESVALTRMRHNFSGIEERIIGLWWSRDRFSFRWLVGFHAHRCSTPLSSAPFVTYVRNLRRCRSSPIGVPSNQTRRPRLRC